MPACMGRYFLSGILGETETFESVPCGTRGGVDVFSAGAQPLTRIARDKTNG
ncbi:hypothetical protein D3C87_1902250 [compost metagenome]